MRSPGAGSLVDGYTVTQTTHSEGRLLVYGLRVYGSTLQGRNHRRNVLEAQDGPERDKLTDGYTGECH